MHRRRAWPRPPRVGPVRTTVPQIVLASRPQGWPTSGTFRLGTAELPELWPGQVLVDNTVMSVDPSMRGRMNDAESCSQPFQGGQPLAEGRIHHDETFRDGLASAPQPFIDMVEGANTGKMIVGL